MNLNKIKATIAGAAIIVGAIVTPAQADEDLELCTAYSGYAETVMEQRQAGVDMAKMMATVPTESETRPTLLKIIELAYDIQRYHTDEFVKRKIQDFRNEVFLECYKSRTARKK